MKRQFFKWAIPCLLLTACFEPELEELPFFSVTTFDIELDSSELLGKVVLKGGIMDLDGAILDDYGFLFSEDSDFVDNKLNIEESLYGVEQLSGDASAFEVNAQIKEGTDYYLRAYAKIGERIILGNLKSYQANLDFGVEIIERHNDVLLFKSIINGLKDGLDVNVEDFGVLIADDSTNLNFNNASIISYGAQTKDTCILDTLIDLNFNTTYYFQAYLIGTDLTKGKIIPYHVQDGWHQINPIPIPLEKVGIVNPITISDGQETYLLSGCFANSDVCGGNDSNKKIYKFTPIVNDNEGEGTWMPLGQIPHPNLAAVKSIGIYFNSQLLLGFGEITIGTFNTKLIDIINGNSICISEDVYITNAVVFSTSDSTIYLGTGKTPDGDTNAFWQLTFTNGCFEVQAMPPLPLRKNGINNIDNAEREGAIALQANNRFFVGFGSQGAFQLNDLYEFHPPLDTTEAHWSFFGFAENVGYREEAMSFNINERAFVGFGYSASNGFLNDLWEFCPNDENNPWKKREPLPAQGRRSGFSFSLNGFGYIGGGRYQKYGPNGGPRLLKDTWVYIPSID